MLHVHPTECLLDEYISIRITRLQPGQHVTLRCETIEGKFVFDSHAHYIGTLNGDVDVSVDPSFGGSYMGIDQMGLFWSMLPALGQMDGLRYFPRSCMDPIKFTLQVYDGHLCEDDFKKSEILTNGTKETKHPIAEGVVLRRCNREGVTRHVVRHGRVRGTIFKPPGPGPFKGVIDMYGGAGGINESRVAMLASHGYIAFTLPHHNYDDLVKTIFDIDGEYFLEAIDYFMSLSTVQPNIGILSVCAGVPIALYLSVISPHVSAVITFGGPYAFLGPIKYQGKKMQHSYIRKFGENATKVTILQDSRGGLYTKEVLEHIPVDDYAIKIEESGSKYLIVAGTDDKSMNALRSGQYMVERMKRYGKGNQITLLAYPGAGHFIDPPFMPKTLLQYFPERGNCAAVGGEVVENSTASVHCWKETLQFLNLNVGTCSKL